MRLEGPLVHCPEKSTELIGYLFVLESLVPITKQIMDLTEFYSHCYTQSFVPSYDCTLNLLFCPELRKRYFIQAIHSHRILGDIRKPNFSLNLGIL